MAFLVEGYNQVITGKKVFFGKATFFIFFHLYPFFKRAITPVSFEQIEKFQCLSLSTPQGLSHGTFRTHVARVTCPETCLKVFQLLGQKSPKTRII